MDLFDIAKGEAELQFKIKQAVNESKEEKLVHYIYENLLHEELPDKEYQRYEDLYTNFLNGGLKDEEARFYATKDLIDEAVHKYQLRLRNSGKK